jgi:hypothetical protein
MSKLDYRAWLHHEYVIKRKTCGEIAAIVGCSKGKVYSALSRFGIKARRGRGRRDHPNGIVLNMSVIEGGLLGDASIQRRKPTHNATFVRTNKNYDHVKYVASLLSDDPDNRISSQLRERVKGSGIKYKSFIFRTLSSNILVPIYKRWYPESSGFKKIVPRDFVLDKVSLLHWFLDDGSTNWRKINGKVSDRRIQLVMATNSFSKDDQEFLASQMEAMGLGVRVGKIQYRTKCFGVKHDGYKRTNIIYVRDSSVQDFFDIIGPPPVESMAYKWKIPSSPVLPGPPKCAVTRDDVLAMREQGMTFKQISERGGISAGYACRLANKA